MNPQKIFRNKKAATPGQQFAMLAFSLLVIVGALFWFGNTYLAIEPDTKTDTTGIIPPTGLEPTKSTVTCDSDKRADYRARYKDTLSKSTSYIADIPHFAIPTDGSRAVRVTGTNTTATGSFASVADSLICDEESPVSYTPMTRTYVKGETSTNAGGYLSDSNPVFVAQGAEVNVDFEGKRQERLQAIITDNTAGITTSEINNTNTVGLGFASFSGTTNLTTQNAQGIIVGAGGELDLTMRIKANQTNAVFGEDDFGYDSNKVFKEQSNDEEKLLSVIISVDTVTATDWSSSGAVISRNSGSAVELQSSDLLVEDDQALNAFDFFYATEPITDKESVINFVLDAADSATNPSSSPLIRFCALAKYNSADLTDTLRVSCFDDSSSRNEVAFKTANTLQISVV